MGRLVRGAAIIFGLALVFVAVLLATTFVMALILGWLRGQEATSPQSLSGGLICALILWLFVAAMHLGRDNLDMAVPNPDSFLDRAREVMKELGYEVVFQDTDLMLCRPGFHSLLFGGGVHIRVKDQHGKVSGPKVMAEVVRRRLRLSNHFERLQQSMSDSRRRSGGSRLLKRVQIAVKVKPQQIDDVQRHVLQPLMEQSSSVVCMLTILAQSDTGIPELGPDNPIRAWLDQQGLKAEFHRDHVELSEPLQATPCARVHETMTVK